MAVEIVRDEIRAARRDEVIVLMDDYGAELHLVIPVSTPAAERASQIAAKTSAHQAGQAQMEAYAAAAKIDLTAQKAAGQEKRAAMKKKYGIAQA